MAGPAHRAKIRMYRQGMRDCFLVSLPRSDGAPRPYHVLIDCGVILGTPDPPAAMTAVVEDIVDVTQGELDLLVVTHRQWDHLSGFVQAPDAFTKLKVREAWLAWTEDDRNPRARELRQERNEGLAALQRKFGELQLAGDAGAAELGPILEFFSLAGAASTQAALERLRAAVAKLRYCGPPARTPGAAGATAEPPADSLVEPEGVAARFYVLGPPRDEERRRQVDPSARIKEAYGVAPSEWQMFIDGGGGAWELRDKGRPFDQQYEIPYPYAADMDFFKRHYWNRGRPADDWRRIDADWLGAAPGFAPQLDHVTDNTSLVLAIELADGDVLLFVGDAQVGSWLSWQDLQWSVGGKTITGPDLLANTIFYKAGHHGIHNATRRDKGLDQMPRLRIAAIPLGQPAAKRGADRMPLDDLLDALAKRGSVTVLRTDQPKPAGPAEVVDKKLYFEVTL